MTNNEGKINSTNNEGKNNMTQTRKNWNIAIVLAGGSGSRMNSDVPKQYMKIGDKPILYYSLKIFEESFVDEIILVTTKQDLKCCKTNIVDKYNFKKITKIVAGGKERYNSVYNGLEAISLDKSNQIIVDNTNIFIHDGARPCVTLDILERCLETVKITSACVAAVPVKDTIKIVDDNGYAISTPDRNTLWQIQTPQVFSYEVIKNAYENLMDLVTIKGITDDAMVVEQYSDIKVKMVEGSYDNVKVTTQGDIELVKSYFKKEMD